MKYIEIKRDLESIPNIKTKDIARYNSKLIKQKEDVSDLKEYILKDQLVYRTYFEVSMKLMDNNIDRFKFIEDNKELLNDWWHVDELICFIKKPLDYEFAYNKAISYINSDLLFVRRFGYVLFLCGLQKDKSHTKEILSLIKDDKEYYVAMAEAWLIADLAVYNVEEVKNYLANTKIKYNITSKAISKINDSFRIDKNDKEYFKSLREKLKNN